MSIWISLFYIRTHCLSFCLRLFSFFLSPRLCGFFYFCPVRIFGLCWKILFSFHQPLCVPQHIQFVFCHSSVKEDDLQLIINCSGILDIKGRFFLWGITWKDLHAFYWTKLLVFTTGKTPLLKSKCSLSLCELGKNPWTLRKHFDAFE